MIHWIAKRKISVGVEKIEVEDGARMGCCCCCWGHLPSKGGHEAGDSRAGCVEVMVHVGQGRVVEHGSEAGENWHRWHANSWIGIASGSP